MILLNIAPPPPPVIQDATYTKYVYQHSIHYVGVGSCIKKGEGGNFTEEKHENVAFWNMVVLYK